MAPRIRLLEASMGKKEGEPAAMRQWWRSPQSPTSRPSEPLCSLAVPLEPSCPGSTYNMNYPIQGGHCKWPTAGKGGTHGDCQDQAAPSSSLRASRAAKSTASIKDIVKSVSAHLVSHSPLLLWLLCAGAAWKPTKEAAQTFWDGWDSLCNSSLNCTISLGILHFSQSVY